DPETRRVVALKDWPKGMANARIAIYHPPSRAMRVLPLQEPYSGYWMSHGEVYFQGAEDMMVADGNTWRVVSRDTYVGKSANDKYWLLRRGGKLYLRTYN